MKPFSVFLFLISIIISQVAAAPNGDAFTALEQQQISVETPGLFSKSQSFQIDLSAIPSNAYSFPLPVAKLSGSTVQEIELETKKGDAVKAMFDGIVRLSRNVSGYGNVIVLRHNNGLETVYCYNAENLVKSGTRVKAGQTIAIVGEKDGRGYLLFSIMINGSRINPATILDIKKHALRRTTLVFTKNGSHVSIKTRRSMELNRDREKKAEEQPVSGTSKTVSHTAVRRAEPEPQMDLETNDPFQGNAVYRLNLDKIKPAQWHYPLDDSHVISGYGGKRGHSGVDSKTVRERMSMLSSMVRWCSRVTSPDMASVSPSDMPTDWRPGTVITPRTSLSLVIWLRLDRLSASWVGQEGLPQNTCISRPALLDMPSIRSISSIIRIIPCKRERFSSRRVEAW